MSIINLLMMAIIVNVLIIIVYYFNKKEYSHYNRLNTVFLIGMGVLFIITIVVSFIKLENLYLSYLYIISASAAFLINFTLRKYFLNKINKLSIIIFLLYLFSLLFFANSDNWISNINFASNLLIMFYFLDISNFVFKTDRIKLIHKKFFSTMFILWSVYSLFTIFFNNTLLYLLGLIFPIVIAYEFINLQLELINEENIQYGKRFRKIFDNASDAIFVINKDTFEILNFNKSAQEVFKLENEKKADINFKNILDESSFNKIKTVIKENKKQNEGSVDLIALDDDNKKKYLKTYVTNIEFKNQSAAILTMKNQTEEIKLRDEVMESKDKIEKLHDVALKMENSSKREEIYNLTIKSAEKILDYDVISLDIVQDNRLVTVDKSKKLSDDGVTSMDLDETSLATKTYHEQRTIVCNNVPAERDASPVKSEYKSALSVPIEEFGVFQIISKKLNYFTEQDKNMVELLISHTVAALKRLNRAEEIRYFGFHDSLTGLYNRDYVIEEIKRLDNSRHLPISVIVADVNGLKLINDTFGHEEGDQLLKKISKTIEETCRYEDIVGRWGGDEFLILLPFTNRKEAQKIINRIKVNLKKETHKKIPLSVSFGCSTKEKKDVSINKVIDKADREMYDHKTKDYQKNSEKMLTVLYKKLDEMGFETKSHCERVEKLAKEFAKQLEINKENLEKIKKAARLHDIGMVNIPKEIVLKNSMLSNEEYEIIKSHPEIGFRIANSLNEVSEICQAILYHHEWWDGSGYPEQKAKEKIPLFARIISIVDAYDIMTHNQIYKDKISKKKAKERLKLMAGIQFDPQLIGIFLDKVLL